MNQEIQAQAVEGYSGRFDRPDRLPSSTDPVVFGLTVEPVLHPIKVRDGAWGHLASATGHSELPAFPGETVRRARRMVMPLDVDSKKKLTLSFSTIVYWELETMARIRKTTVAQIISQALGLIRLVIGEINQGNKLVIVGPDGRPRHEVVLP
jgi:hypothetical protein